MKKILSITMSIFMLISMFAFCASAKNPTYGDYEYKVTEDGTVSIVKYNGNDEVVSIPEKIAKKDVTIIAKGAFQNNLTLKEVTIPKSIETVGYYAFSGCSKLEKVTINSGVKKILDKAFYYCTSLKSIKLPNSVTSVGSAAFGDCESLENIKFSSKITTLGQNVLNRTGYANNDENWDGAFLYLGKYLISSKSTSLPKTVKIKEGTVLIANSAVTHKYDSTQVKKIVFPNSLKYIGSNAFSGHEYLQSVKFGNSLVSIEKRAFYGCTSLKNVTVPASVKTIGKMALGYYWLGKGDEFDVVEGFTITGYANTAAEKYANKNGIEFKFQKPQTPKVKVTAGEKQIKVKYTKALGADGFQISYTVGKKTYTKTYETTKTITKTLKNLKEGTYQVKVRAFTKTDTKKIYSKWTDTVSVKVK